MLYIKTIHLLDELEIQLKLVDLWSEQAPSEQALASTVPFACDQMSFSCWLQFIFLPRMRMLISAKQPLPNRIALSPMAEQVWQGHSDMQGVMLTINQLDTLLNDA